MYKKIISMLLFIIILFTAFNIAFAEFGTDDNGNIEVIDNNLMIHAQHNFSSAGTKYHILGYKFEFIINGKSYSGYIADNSGITGSGLQDVAIPVPFIGDSNSIMGILLSKYPNQQDKDNLENYLTAGGTITLNAVITIKENGVLKGAVNADGNHTSGEVYYNYTGIVNARSWSANTVTALKTQFNLNLTFDGIATPPTAKISKDGTIVNGTTVRYNLGDKLNLSGILSVFPSFASKKYYTWDYKPKGAATWTNIVSKQINAVNPTFPSLSKGQYDVRLQVYYDIFDTMTGTATTTVVIDDAVYVDTTVTIDADRKVTQDEIDNNATIDVHIMVKGTLKNFNDTSKISKWALYCRKEPFGSGDQLQTNITTSNLGLTAQYTFNMSVQANELKSQNTFLQKYAVRAVCTISSDISGDLLYGSHSIYKNNPPPQQPGNLPPVADIQAPSVVMAGDDVNIDGSGSTDPDGSITNYTWDIPGASGTITGAEGTVWFTGSGTYTISLTVTDNAGGIGAAQKTIQVMPPVPSAIIKYTGKPKENRKISIDSTSSCSPSHYPIDKSYTQWEVTAVSGCTNTDIKYAAPLAGVTAKDILVKKSGQIKVKLTVRNSAGYTGTASIIIDIAADAAPVADYTVPATILRDQVDSNGVNYAIIPLTCTSYSPDGDLIGKRKWVYRYDSDNDGNYLEESEVIISNLNKLTEIIKAYDVGRYAIGLTVTETIPNEETIASFINPSDARSTTIKTW